MPVVNLLLAFWTAMSVYSGDSNVHTPERTSSCQALSTSSINNLICNCSITQGANSYPISALLGVESAVNFYDYGIPSGSSANTGLELEDALILFLYEEIATGVISLFLIADITNDDDGGALTFEFNCAPAASFISVQDDAGEFFGSPPLFTGNWSWGTCCTDGGVIENIGCNSTLNLDLLVSSGIDSIVWLTGDIANPTHILLDLTGDAISINCGGSVCCPIGLDTEIMITDATCEDSPNGSINVDPQDGLPAYTYSWSNGATTANNTGLVPGVYEVTITDSQGCTEELEMTVGVSPGAPPAQPSSMDICSSNAQDEFDLTTLDPVINLGSGFNVLWFENSDLTGQILNPSAYLSGSTTVFAVVDNGPCFSEPVPVVLTLYTIPVANEASIELCEETNESALFDLTEVDNIISPGGDEVLWYLSSNGSNPIPNPSSFWSASQTVYAAIDDGHCLSLLVPVELIVHLKPEGTPTEAHLCSDAFDQAIFDLVSLEQEITGGSNTVEWYLEIDLIDLITNPSFFQTTTTIVYAVVSDGVCFSDPVPVNLIVDPTPVGNPLTAQACDDGSNTAVFILTDYDFQISGGSGGVDWFLDLELTEPVANPNHFVTPSTIVYATIDDGSCISNPVPVTLNVVQSPVGVPSSIETCAEGSGEGLFNLTAIDSIVNGGVGSVLWYSDPAGLDLIVQPGNYSSFGGTVYAQINDGGCLSQLVPVDLIIVNSVSATPAQLSACDDGTGSALFNLSLIENAVSGGTGLVSWFIDFAGMFPIIPPNIFISGDSIVYARVNAGTCVSDMVPVELFLLNTPVAPDIGIVSNICGDGNGELTFNLTSLDSIISSGMGSVLWFSDVLMTTVIPNPSSFFTGDTIVYAFVSNGTCTSPPVLIQLNVTPALIANPVTMEFCVPDGDTLLIDLTQFNASINGNTGATVQWFSDVIGMNVISNPASFSGSSSQTLYVNTTDGNCASPIIPIPLNILTDPDANALSINRCGDPSGQITVDLTSLDSLVSGNTGTVIWYSDESLSNVISNPQNLVTGDTILFATVANGFCVSSPVEISISIVDSLIANSLVIELCAVDNDTPAVNLAFYEFAVSGGSGSVNWFTDNIGNDTIPNPSVFNTDGQTLYASISADGCISGIVSIPVEISLSNQPVAACDFTSIDSISISWLGTADDFELSYTINGQNQVGPMLSSMNEFSLGGLGQADTIDLTITALYDSICDPLTSTVTCITDFCPPLPFTFPGLLEDYCRDTVYVPLTANPPGGVFTGIGISNDTLFTYVVLANSTEITYTYTDPISGCVYDTSFRIHITDPWQNFDLHCGDQTFESISFDWDPVAEQYGYSYTINNGPATPLTITTNDTFLLSGLQPGDSVVFTLWSIGVAPCFGDIQNSVWCITKECPVVDLSITNPGILCSDSEPVYLEVIGADILDSPTITWSGDGIIEPGTGLFDPIVAGPEGKLVIVTVEKDGCIYTDSLTLTIFQSPVAAFEIIGSPCVDSTLEIIFNGSAYASGEWDWDFAGADVVQGNTPVDFFVKWDTPGEYLVSLEIDYFGCISNRFETLISIDETPGQITLNCAEEDYYSISIDWEPVQGATSYTGSSSFGSGVISGTTYTLTNLPDNTLVDITIEALGAAACGKSSANIQCQTLDYIPPAIYVGDIFSPNNDGINDIIYIQTNSKITEINVFRVFDRWGNMVFEKLGFLPNDPLHGWDGMFMGKLLNPGVYLYWVQGTTDDQEEIIITGDITLLH